MYNKQNKEDEKLQNTKMQDTGSKPQHIYIHETHVYVSLFDRIKLIVLIIIIASALMMGVSMALDGGFESIFTRIENNIKYSKEDLQLLELYEFTEVDGGYSISALNTNFIGEVMLPESFDGQPVVAISKNAFSGCNKVTKFIIPETVTYIAAYAFKGCSNLTSINLSPLTTFIGAGAFSDCSSITEICLPESLIEIEHVNFTESGAFDGCTSLKTVRINAKLQEIPYHTFESCVSLENVYIPNGDLLQIGNYSFSNAINVKNIYFDGNIQEWNRIVVYETAFNRNCDITAHCSDGSVAVVSNGY